MYLYVYVYDWIEKKIDNSQDSSEEDGRKLNCLNSTWNFKKKIQKSAATSPAHISKTKSHKWNLHSSNRRSNVLLQHNSILHFPHSLFISKISNMKVKFCSCSPSTLSIVVQSISMCVSHCKCWLSISENLSNSEYERERGGDGKSIKSDPEKVIKSEKEGKKKSQR